MSRMLEFAEKHPVLWTLIGLAVAILLGVLFSASEDLLASAALYIGCIGGSMACGLGLAAWLEHRSSPRIQGDTDARRPPLATNTPARVPELDALTEHATKRFTNHLVLEFDWPERLH